MNEKYQTESLKQKKQVRESCFGSHACLFCGTKFINKKDLDLHSRLHDKNKSFICLLCKEVFPELKLLKLHDLRHSLEEAHEDISDIDNWFTSLALRCRVCGERFSCDEELVEHFVNRHKTVQNMNNGIVEVSTDDLSSDSCDSSGEEQINYPLLREEIITKNGVMYIRFTLIDHPNVQVGEFTRIVEHKIKKKKIKSDLKPKKFPKLIDNKLNTKKGKVKLSSSKKMSNKVINKKIQDRKEIPKFSSTLKKPTAKIPKLRSNCVPIDLSEVSSDSDVEIVFENQEKNKISKSRQSKVLALKKKIWKNSPSPGSPKVCHFCQKSFISVEAYENHLLTHKKYKCKKCFQVFRSATLLHRHTVLYHVQAKKNSHQCETCHKEFSSIFEWKIHIKTHSTKQVQCSKCLKEFRNEMFMSKHICKYNLICKICNCKLARLYNLKRHLRSVHKLEEEELKKLLPVFPENSQKIEMPNQDTQLALDNENDKNSKENVAVPNNPLLNGKINEKKRVSLTSDLNPVSLKEEESVVSLKKKKLTVKNIKPIKVIPSKQVKKISLSNRKRIESDKKNIVPKDKVGKSIEKTSKKTTKKLSSLKQLTTKQFIPKKSIKKTKASVPYQSKGNNYKQSVKKLMVNKGKKKITIGSKNSDTKRKLSTPSQKNKPRPKKIK